MKLAIQGAAEWMRMGAPLLHKGASLTPVKQIEAIMVYRAGWQCGQIPQLALFAEPEAAVCLNQQEMTIID